MDTITVISSDKKTFKISEYQAKMFTFPRLYLKKDIILGCNGEIVKLLLDHAEIYMYQDKQKVYTELVKYVHTIKKISKLEKFALIRLAQQVSYEKIDSLVKLIKLC